jgi:hypothetical protein
VTGNCEFAAVLTRLARVDKTCKIMRMSSGRFDSLERQATDRLDVIIADVEKDREELAAYSGQEQRVGRGGNAPRFQEVGAQQGLSNATELLKALRQLSRSLNGPKK